jgi:hypothetical protein
MKSHNKQFKPQKAWAIIDLDIMTIMSNIERWRMLELYETRDAAKLAESPNTCAHSCIIPVLISPLLPKAKRTKTKK